MTTTPQLPNESQPPFASTDTFAVRYCARHGLEPSAYLDTVLRAALYPHARLLRWVLPWSSLSVDRAFVDGVGRVRCADDFHREVRDFVEDPAGHTWLRDVLYLRVSARRLRRLVRGTFEAEARVGQLETKKAAVK